MPEFGLTEKNEIWGQTTSEMKHCISFLFILSDFLSAIDIQTLHYVLPAVLVTSTTPFPDSFFWSWQWSVFGLETMPCTFLSSISILSWQQHPTTNQGFGYNLNVDDTVTYISNQYFSPILVLRFLLLAGYLDGISNQHVPTAESFFPDSGQFLLSPSVFQLLSQAPALLPVLIHVVTKSCQFNLRNGCGPFPLFGPYCSAS